MSAVTTTNETNPPQAPPAKATRATQDQQMANDIAAGATLLLSAKGDAEIAALLEARGYGVAKLDEGLAVQAAAQGAYNARQTALALSESTGAALETAEATARRSYADFREVGRVVAAESTNLAAARTALALGGKVPNDRQKFLTQARASYTAAQQSPYAASFATYGYAAEGLIALIATLDALDQAQRAKDAAFASAAGATTQRDAAFKALKEWLASFRRIAKVALRPRPDLAGKLGV